MSKKDKGIVRPDFSRERDQKLDYPICSLPGMSTQVIDADGQPGTSMDGARILPLDLSTTIPTRLARCSTSTALQELADSIREHGVIEPVIVRPSEIQRALRDRGG